VDAISLQLLAGAVADLTSVRNRAVAKGDLETVMELETALTRLVAVEAHEQGAGDVTIRLGTRS